MSATGRYSLIFQLSTVPVQPIYGLTRTGGWTESIWGPPGSGVVANWPNPVAQARAALLPNQAKIIGWEIENYTYTVNKLIPAGSLSGGINYPGSSGLSTDIPQMTLQVKWNAVVGTNKTVSKLRAIPDFCVTTGEFNPPPGYAAAVTAWTGTLNGFGWMARDLSQGPVRVMSLNAGTLVTDAAIPNVANKSWIRFRRVYDTNGRPVKGSYQVDTFTPPNTYVLVSPPTQTVSKPSGTVRNDLLIRLFYNQSSFGEIIVQKVGKPSRGYRGRRSRQRI